jgi:hypothetical protein
MNTCPLCTAGPELPTLDDIADPHRFLNLIPSAFPQICVPPPQEYTVTGSHSVNLECATMNPSLLK